MAPFNDSFEGINSERHDTESKLKDDDDGVNEILHSDLAKDIFKSFNEGNQSLEIRNKQVLSRKMEKKKSLKDKMKKESVSDHLDLTSLDFLSEPDENP